MQWLLSCPGTVYSILYSLDCVARIPYVKALLIPYTQTESITFVLLKIRTKLISSLYANNLQLP